MSETHGSDVYYNHDVVDTDTESTDDKMSQTHGSDVYYNHDVVDTDTEYTDKEMSGAHGSDVYYNHDVVDTDTEYTDEEMSATPGSDVSYQYDAQDTGGSEAESYSIQEYETTHNKGRRKLYQGGDCYRDCTKYPEPRVCYFHLVVEAYPTMNTACTFCTPNPNNTNHAYDNCTCILADGYDRVATVFNRRMPGTGINVCVRDTIVADVQNKLQSETSVHWHGIRQEGTQYYDGVPFVTQCPIASGTTFRYEFEALYPGTYWYHSHSGLQTYDGMSAALVIREPQERDLHRALYDVDTPDYTIFLQDILHRPANSYYPGTTEHDTGSLPDNFLINGFGTYIDRDTGNETTTPFARFIVEKGKKYRMRVICACASTCPLQLTIEGHNMTLIATDGHAVDPVIGDTLLCLAAERYDFVLHASNETAAYWIQLKGLGGCATDQIQQLAIVQYEGAPATPSTPRPTYNISIPTTSIFNALGGNCTANGNICVSELSNANKSAGLHECKPDITHYISLGTYNISSSEWPEFYSPGNHTDHEVVTQRPFIAHMNGIQFKLPTSPPISQEDDLDSSYFCSPTNSNSSEIRHCTQVIRVPLGKVLRLCVADIGLGGGPHAMHLHGTHMLVEAVGNNNTLGVPVVTLENLKEAVENNKIAKPHKRGQRIPPYKDTFAIPNRGFAILKLKTDNPGWWLFHCHFNVHNMIGLDLIFRFGKRSDLPPVPKFFPKCGNFVNDIKALDKY